ncbi:dihydrofolate reductase [Olsenella uli]|uniref:dihydrofolate reductase n=1 Tax=Olsenella uli TaxID=133926 RepID=UPI0024A87968|nr:dihydrofolate reductase [Olsenella uli]
MNAIVSVTSDWGIGNNGRLLVRNRADMHRFVELTRGGTVLMGRTTFESFPKGPLVGRRNVVITHDAHYERAGYPRSDGARRDAGGGGGTGYEVYTTPEDALRAVVGEGDGKVWLIGGESVYRALLPRCSRAYVTKNDTVVEADAYFPNLDENPAWQIADSQPGGVTPEGVSFSFVTYERRS